MGEACSKSHGSNETQSNSCDATSQWMQEAKQKFSGLKVILFQGEKRNRLTAQYFAQADIIFSTVETVVSRGWRSVEFRKYHFHRVVLDEYQNLRMSQSLRQAPLSTSISWVVSGTPSAAWNDLNQDFYELLGFRGFVGVVGRSASSRRDFISAKIQRDPTETMLNLCKEGETQIAAEKYHEEFTGNAHRMLQHDPLSQSLIFYRASLFREKFSRLLCQQFVKRHLKSEVGFGEKEDHIEASELSLEEVIVYNANAEPIIQQFNALNMRARMDAFRSIQGWVDDLRRVATNALLHNRDRLWRVADFDANERNILVNEAHAEAQLAANEVDRKNNIRTVDIEMLTAIFQEKHVMNDSLKEYLEGLVKEAPEHTDCTVCTDVLMQPVFLNCGHFFCAECVLMLAETAPQRGNDDSCPMCRAHTLRAVKFRLQMPKPKEETEEDEENVETQQVEEKQPPKPEQEAPKMTVAQALRRIRTPAKIRQIIRLIRETRQRDPTAKFVIFSSFAPMFASINSALIGADVQQSGVAGNNPSNPVVCLISSRAGNAGLTLTAANHMILMEPSTNIAIDEQAIGRIHRMGAIFTE